MVTSGRTRIRSVPRNHTLPGSPRPSAEQAACEYLTGALCKVSSQAPYAERTKNLKTATSGR